MIGNSPPRKLSRTNLETLFAQEEIGYIIGFNSNKKGFVSLSRDRGRLLWLTLGQDSEESGARTEEERISWKSVYE